VRALHHARILSHSPKTAISAATGGLRMKDGAAKPFLETCWAGARVKAGVHNFQISNFGFGVIFFHRFHVLSFDLLVEEEAVESVYLDGLVFDSRGLSENLPMSEPCGHDGKETASTTRRIHQI
jgi:hypothetical protein